MPEPLTAFLAHGSLLAMWGALALHWLLAIPPALHPVRHWQLVALRLAAKVNKNKDKRSQRQLSGTLAWLLMWLTMLILLIALRQLVWIDILFNLTLLWLALDWKHTSRLAKSVITALAKEHKQTCRNLLAGELNRNTTSLSTLGLGKAAAETLLLGYGRHVAGVLFWYALAGGIGAIMYRLTVALARSWSPSREQYQVFGLTAVRILALADLIPLRILAILLSLGSNTKQAIRALWQQGENWLLPGPGWLLVATGAKFNLSLGGPAIYGDKKIERPRIGGKVAPAAIHLAQIHRIINARLLIWIVLQSGLLFIFHGGA